MIAVPRPDGGITVHGSMQCPYYIHVAMQRALDLTGEQAVIVQAETGGGFGGKEEYPSMIALHAALLAQRLGRPVRMIYDRHEDLGATTKRHPAIVRHRTGVTRDGRLVAQDIEVVMDGGAYCTLTPVVLSRGTIHAAGAYNCPNVRIQGARWRPTRRPTAPSAASARRRPSSPPRCRSTASPRRSACRRSSCAVAGSTASATRRPIGQVLRESVAGEEVLERAAEAAEFERDAQRMTAPSAAAERHTPESRQAGSRTCVSARAGTARGIGLALAWHGAGFTGSGEVKLASVVSIELECRRRDARADRFDRDGPGHQDDLSAAGRRGAGRRSRRSRAGAAGHLDRARLRADGRVADGNGRRWPGDQGGATAARAGRGAPPAARSPNLPPTTPANTGRSAGGPAFRAVSRRRVRRRRPTAATRIRPTAGRARWPRSTSTSIPARSRCANVVSADDVGHAIHPRAGRGPGRGRHAAGRWLRHDRGDQAGRRPLPERPPGDVPDPHRARRAAHRIDPRRSSRSLAHRTVPRASASCPWTCRPRQLWRPSTTRRAPGSTTCPATPERILAALHGITPPPSPGISTVSPRSQIPAPSARNAGTPQEGLDPRPDAPTDPQPTRGPYDGEWRE